MSVQASSPADERGIRSSKKLTKHNPSRATPSSMNHNRLSMPDAPTHPRSMPAPSHSRTSSLFGSFTSFRTRAAASGRSQTLPALPENVPEVSNDFGLRRPPLQSSTSTPIPTASQPARARVVEPMTHAASASMSGISGSPSPQHGASQQQLHPEIRSIVQLSVAHAHKVYFSGQLVRHIERQTDGRIVGKEEPWRDVWAQLGGTTLSVWDMREIEEANRRGAEVPPTYINVTDASIHVLGSVTMPTSDGTPMKYTNVITLTTAGLNLILFSCPSPQALLSWVSALRLAAYEKSRLEELYTAHLLRMAFSDDGTWRDPRSPLCNGRLEGWVKIRINGQTDWKRMWMLVQTSKDAEFTEATQRKGRMSSLFNRPHYEPTNSQSSDGVYSRSSNIALFTSPKSKDRKKAVLTMDKVTQVFAVYPERPELISRSTLIKTEGFIGNEDLAGEWKTREGWLLMMPEPEPGRPVSMEMLKWLVALHDAFSLYGRPSGYTWNPREPQSLMFAYPVGPQKDQLFLDRELAERIDPREDRASLVRQKMKDILIERMYGREANRLSMASPSTPPNTLPATQNGFNEQMQQNESYDPLTLPQLPPLSFDGALDNVQAKEAQHLSPVAERSEAAMERARVLESVRSHGSGNLTSPDVIVPSRIPSESLQGSPRPSDATQNQAQGTANAQNILHSVPKLRRASDVSSPTSVTDSTNVIQNVRSQMPQRANDDPGFNDIKDPQKNRNPENHNLHVARQSSQSSQSTNNGLGIEHEPVSPTHSTITVLSPPFSMKDAEMKDTSGISQYRTPETQNHLPSEGPRMEQVMEKARKFDSRINEDPYSTQQHSGNAIHSRLVSDKHSDSESEHSLLSNPMSFKSSTKQVSPMLAGTSQDIMKVSTSSISRRSTPVAFEHSSNSNSSATEDKTQTHNRRLLNSDSQASGEQGGGTRVTLTRKPSGARAQPRVSGKRFVPSAASSSLEVHEQPHPAHPVQHSTAPMSAPSAASVIDDDTVAALAALSFLDQDSSQTAEARAERLHDSASESQSPDSSRIIPQIMEPADLRDRASPPIDERTRKHQYRSSFSPSKIAEERKARSQAQQAAHEAAVHKPGRPNGKRVKRREDGWDSSEEEDEDDEEDDEEDDGNADPSATPNRLGLGGPVVVTPAVNQQQIRGMSRSNTPVDGREQPGQQRATRALPQIPRGSSPAGPDRRNTPDHCDAQRNVGIARPQASYPHQHSHLPPSPFGASRQNMWSSVLDANRDPAMTLPAQNNNRDTFVQLESPSETMTKAFTPQGLLSAGLQDKEERSAKRQEELARNTGASLINVPSKPPPPQTGLLGAISAHERERNREGGMGAALTEREREKRFAEERQRRIDDLQRQQLEQQQQFASQYGGAMNMYSGGLVPQMTGVNPMFGFPPMMPQSMYFPPMFNPMMANPQHMYAAQQAAQAYQQAMVAMSQAGSQLGGEGGAPGAGGNMPTNSTLNPMMGFDPRMSMYGVGMMNPMGMMSMPAMGGVGMQMTGGSIGVGAGVDPHFSPNSGPLDGPGGLSNIQTPRLSPVTGSPAGTPAATARGDNEAPAGR